MRCGGSHDKSKCDKPNIDSECANCGGNHAAFTLNCPSRLDYIREFPELHRSSKSKPKFQRKVTQTTPTIDNNPKLTEERKQHQQQPRKLSWADLVSPIQNEKPFKTTDNLQVLQEVQT